MINRLPQITLVFDRRKRATSSKKGVVEIRVTYDRKQHACLRCNCKKISRTMGIRKRVAIFVTNNNTLTNK